MNPADLRLLEVNARYMRHEIFQRLIDNIQRDGGLTGNAPFAWLIHDDATGAPSDPPMYEVLSGNHRVKAAVSAGLDLIDVCLTDQHLPPDRRKAIQLAHNALVGEDDPAILKLIYDGIDDVQLRLYSGLDDKLLGLLEGVSVSALSEAALDFQIVSLTFLPHEREHVEETLDRARDLAKGAKAHWLARWDEYDRALDALEAAQQANGIKNSATALMVILEVFWNHIDELADGYLDALGEPVDPKRQIPTASALGVTIPARLAALIRKLPGEDKAAALEDLLTQQQPADTAKGQGA
jgi:ParB-like chromosome segregation protein Spo0J